MTAPTPEAADIARSVKALEAKASATLTHFGSRFPSDARTVLDALAAVTAERDQARQMLADVWDEGVSFGWHSTELRTDENPYRKAGL